METVLVTGGAGFIGSNIAEKLLSEGYAVIVLDDLSTGYKNNINHLLQDSRFKFIEGSILDSGLLRSIIKLNNVSLISHQAAIPSVEKSIINPMKTIETNITGTTNLFDIASQRGCKRIVFASSCSIYGDTRELPIRESFPFNSKSPYAASKAANEMLAAVFSGLYDMRIIGLRYFNVYGRRQDPASDYAAVIPRFITKALANEAIPIEGDGMQTRDFIYIDDVVQANIKALTGKDVPGTVFNIACGKQTSILGLANMIIGITGSRSGIVYLSPRPGDVRDSLADIENARNHLDYTPRYDMKSGLVKTVDWFKHALAFRAHSDHTGHKIDYIPPCMSKVGAMGDLKIEKIPFKPSSPVKSFEDKFPKGDAAY